MKVMKTAKLLALIDANYNLKDDLVGQVREVLAHLVRHANDLEAQVMESGNRAREAEAMLHNVRGERDELQAKVKFCSDTLKSVLSKILLLSIIFLFGCTSASDHAKYNQFKFNKYQYYYLNLNNGASNHTVVK